MSGPYLYPGENILRNLLNIHDEKALDLAEAELSRANMMLLYEQGFGDFSGSCDIGITTASRTENKNIALLINEVAAAKTQNKCL